MGSQRTAMTEQIVHSFRSFLFTPGNHPRKVAKVFDAGADAVILDLEDAVALTEKIATRDAVVDAMRRPRTCLGYVRVNGLDTPFCYGDVLSVIGPDLDGIILPMVERASDLVLIDWLVSQVERERGMDVGTTDILPIIETGLGLRNVDEIAHAGTRVKRLSFGAGDFTRDMGMRWTRHESELGHARACVALASRTAGLEPPIDTVFIDLKDEEGLIASTEIACDIGFQGKLCIHPAQIDPVNTVFTPSIEELERARKFITAFEEAEAAGSASIQVDGYFIDYPIVEKARRVLATMEGIRRREAGQA